MFLCWWNISNAKRRYTHNKLSNAIIEGDGKTSFYLKLADWIESWSTISDFCFSKQTANALILTLRSQAMLIEELLYEGYDFVLTQRLQSDKLENRFSQYRQMSGGKFLVGLRENQSSERILKCLSLLKAGIDFWIEEKDSHQEQPIIILDSLMECESDLLDASLSSDSLEVAHLIAGYVAKNILTRFKCDHCVSSMTSSKDSSEYSFNNKYFDALNRGGLTVPSTALSDFVSSSFAILGYAKYHIENNLVRHTAEHLLKKYAPKSIFACDQHSEEGFKFASRTVVNIFYNNKQKICRDDVRKDAVKIFKKRQRSNDLS